MRIYDIGVHGFSALQLRGLQMVQNFTVSRGCYAFGNFTAYGIIGFWVPPAQVCLKSDLKFSTRYHFQGHPGPQVSKSSAGRLALQGVQVTQG